MLNLEKAEAEKYLQNELLEGEKLLWSGQAGKGIRFVLRDIVFIPFSMLWFGGALTWELIVLIGAPFLFKIIFSLIGVPFVCFGFYLSAGRFLYDMKRRANTFYGVTEKRVIIKLCTYKTAVEIFNINELSCMVINERSDGSGTIKLYSDLLKYAAWKPGYVSRKTVWAIEYVGDVRTIYNLILQQQDILNKSALSDHLKEIALINSSKKQATPEN